MVSNARVATCVLTEVLRTLTQVPPLILHNNLNNPNNPNTGHTGLISFGLFTLFFLSFIFFRYPCNNPENSYHSNTGMISFDNWLIAMFTLYQNMSITDWTKTMYKVMTLITLIALIAHTSYISKSDIYIIDNNNPINPNNTSHVP